MYLVQLKPEDNGSNIIPDTFCVDAGNSEALEEKLAKIFDQKVSVLFIDSIDMGSRDYDAQIRLEYRTVKANISHVKVYQ